MIDESFFIMPLDSQQKKTGEAVPSTGEAHLAKGDSWENFFNDDLPKV